QQPTVPPSQASTVTFPESQLSPLPSDAAVIVGHLSPELTSQSSPEVEVPLLGSKPGQNSISSDPRIGTRHPLDTRLGAALRPRKVSFQPSSFQGISFEQITASVSKNRACIRTLSEACAARAEALAARRSHLLGLFPSVSVPDGLFPSPLAPTPALSLQPLLLVPALPSQLAAQPPQLAAQPEREFNDSDRSRIVKDLKERQRLGLLPSQLKAAAAKAAAAAALQAPSLQAQPSKPTSLERLRLIIDRVDSQRAQADSFQEQQAPPPQPQPADSFQQQQAPPPQPQPADSFQQQQAPPPQPQQAPPPQPHQLFPPQPQQADSFQQQQALPPQPHQLFPPQPQQAVSTQQLSLPLAAPPLQLQPYHFIGTGEKLPRGVFEEVDSLTGWKRYANAAGRTLQRVTLDSA
ncbi:hypothetical protein B484DRAFT_460979, partial [Ochromonadaceae sp. CCMP2298]